MVKKANVSAVRQLVINTTKSHARPCCSRHKYKRLALDLGSIDKELERLDENVSRAAKVLALAIKGLEEAQSDETERE